MDLKTAHDGEDGWKLFEGISYASRSVTDWIMWIEWDRQKICMSTWWGVGLGIFYVLMWLIEAAPALWRTSWQLPYYVSSLKGVAGSGRMQRCTFRISRLWILPAADESKSQHLSHRSLISATSRSRGLRVPKTGLSPLPHARIRNQTPCLIPLYWLQFRAASDSKGHSSGFLDKDFLCMETFCQEFNVQANMTVN